MSLLNRFDVQKQATFSLTVSNCVRSACPPTTGNDGNKNIRIRDEVIEKVNKFKYLGAYVTSKNEVAEEINSRLVSGNASFYSVQKLLTSRLISRILKLKIYRTVILSVILYGCESWSTTLADEHKMRVFENRFSEDIRAETRRDDWRVEQTV